MKDEYKLTFWKKLKYSIFDFDKYQDLAAEKIWKTVVYLIILIAVFSIATSGIYMYKVIKTVDNVKQYVSDHIETITFEENNLTVVPKDDKKETVIEENEHFSAKIIINTDISGDVDVEGKKDEFFSDSNNAIIVLGDRILIKNELLTGPITYRYEDLIKQYQFDGSLNKDDVIKFLTIDSINPITVTIYGALLLYMFMMYFSTILIDIFIFSIMGYLVTLITKIRIKYSAVYNIAAHALTLPIILNILYVIFNGLTGFTIQYFQVMYIAITSIYIIAAILLIKSDVIKKQIELARIIEEQEKVKEELKRREEEEKEEAERERQKREQQKKEREKKNNEESEGTEKKKRRKTKGDPDVNIGKEPEGDNV